MSWYKPVNSLESPRFCGIRTFMRLPHVETTDGVDFGVIGVPFDTGVTFRVGSRFGPSAIRSISALLRPYNPGLGIAIFEHCSGVDYGDVPVVPGCIEESYDRTVSHLLPLLKAGVVPIILGGDHSISLANLRAVAKVHGPVALVQFDSHADTTDSYFGNKYTHGTPFRRAVEEGLLDVDRSIQVGMRGSIYTPEDWAVSKGLGFALYSSDEVREMGFKETAARVRERVGGAPCFLSFDIDFVDPAFAPGTGTPEVGGFTGSETLSILRGLKGVPFVGFDLVEVLPGYDQGEVTALLAANIAYEFISLLALNRRDRV